MSPGHVTLDKSCSKCLPWLRRQTRNRNLIFNRPLVLSHYGDTPEINSEVFTSVKQLPGWTKENGILWGQGPLFPLSGLRYCLSHKNSPFTAGLANSNLGSNLHGFCLFVLSSVVWHNVSLSFVGRPHWRHCGVELRFLAHFLALGPSQSKLPSTALEQDASWVTFLSE